jgi:photosystem II oxygen-evolving enhancer protein 1
LLAVVSPCRGVFRKDEVKTTMRYRAVIVSFLVLCLSFLTACENGTEASQGNYTYEDIKGTGLANTCPTLAENSRGSINLNSDTSYKLRDLCLQPQQFYVKEESPNRRKEAEFVRGKPLTMSSTSLAQIQGDLKTDEDGKLKFVEEDGIDFQPITVLLPGGEELALLFSVKNLVATTTEALQSVNTSTDFEGQFQVPSYRSPDYQDPRGRGAASGYDYTAGLVALDPDEEVERFNAKRTSIRSGNISLQVSNVNPNTGEMSGIFESIQPSNTEEEGYEPKDVKIRGQFYARVEEAFES